MKPVISVYIVYAKDDPESHSIAKHLLTLLSFSIKEPLEKAISIPVYYRPVSPNHILPIDYNESEKTLVIILVSKNLARLNAVLEQLSIVSDESRRVLPVSLFDRPHTHFSMLANINFTPYFNIDIEGSILNIELAILHELCKLCIERNGQSKPVKLFISHSKHDESSEVAKKFRNYILQDTQLDTFFDANDIGYGLDFGKEIKDALEQCECALVIFHSDSYSSREWCRVEVITAKENNCPVVVVNAISNGEKRTFPYMGNCPSIRLKANDPNFKQIINTTLEQVLQQTIQQRKLDRIIEENQLADTVVISNCPELLSVAGLCKKNPNTTRFLYPDPPLGAEELRILALLDKPQDFVTPIEYMAAASKIPENRKIALSASAPDSIEELGFSPLHLTNLVLELARYIFSVKGIILYGGDLRKPGLTEAIYDLLRHYNYANGMLPKDRFLSYLTWPHTQNIGEETEFEMSPYLQINKVEVKLAGIDINQLAVSKQGYFYMQGESLTEMRKQTTDNSDARILVGGKQKDYQGKAPGILEELYYSISATKPIYLIGAYGGAANVVCEILNGNKQISSMLSKPKHALVDDYSSLGVEMTPSIDTIVSKLENISWREISKTNGLSEDENVRLSKTTHTSEIIQLVFKGMSKIFSE